MKERTQKLVEGFFDRWPALALGRDAILKAYEMILTTYRAGGKLLLCGNGGSCADCDHIAGELMKGFLLRRPLTDGQKDAFDLCEDCYDSIVSGFSIPVTCDS